MCFRAPLGGLFRHVCDLSLELQRRGVSVGLVCNAALPLGAAEHGNIAGAARLGVKRLRIPRLPAPIDVVNMVELIRHARALDIDVVHGHGAKGGLYARALGRMLRRPAVYTPHGGSLHYSPGHPYGRAFFAMEKLLLRATDGLILESDFALTQFQAKVGLPDDGIRVVHNGLADADFAPADDTRRLYDFVYVGEFRELKGVDVLLRAAARIEARGRKFSLALYGKGANEPKFRLFARSLGLTGIVWHGWQPSGRAAMETAACLVVPSRHESLPYTVLEAAAMGMPIIATRTGGIPEILGAGYPLVPPGDDHALAARMEEFLENRACAVTAALPIRQRVRELFRVEHMATQILELYRELSRDPSSIGTMQPAIRPSLRE